MNIKKVLGKNIQEYRKSKNITQEELAEIVGIDTISMSKIETGRNYPTADNLNKIAKAIGLEVYELFVENAIRTNEELLSEINKDLTKISKDNKKLHILYTTLKSII